MKKSILISVVLLNAISIGMSIYWGCELYKNLQPVVIFETKHQPVREFPLVKTKNEKLIQNYYKNEISDIIHIVLKNRGHDVVLMKQVFLSHLFIAIAWLILSLILCKGKNSNKSRE